MTKDILNEFGSGSSQPQRASAGCGGVLPGQQKDVMGYKPPVGPKGINDPKAPGLHDDTVGTHNRPMEGHTHSGSPGIGGTNHGCCGSQGKY